MKAEESGVGSGADMTGKEAQYRVFGANFQKNTIFPDDLSPKQAPRRPGFACNPSKQLNFLPYLDASS
jgi:hypothetical protein